MRTDKRAWQRNSDKNLKIKSSNLFFFGKNQTILFKKLSNPSSNHQNQIVREKKQRTFTNFFDNLQMKEIRAIKQKLTMS